MEISQSEGNKPKIIFDRLLDELIHSGDPVDIKSKATPERYRLVECKPLASSDRASLRIWEFHDITSVSYCTISYVWRGNVLPEGVSFQSITVRGAEEADPIGTQVLQQTCIAALKQGTNWLWIDRLCILQTKEDTADRNWQITKMYHLYKSCSACLVIPGGLLRLVSLQEETGWIHRGWTLQESLAPEAVKVLFEWPHGDCRGACGYGLGDDSGWYGEIEDILPGQSAVAPLWLILDACLSGRLKLFKSDEPISHKTIEPIHLFGVGAGTLGGGRSDKNFRFALPNVAALALCLTRSMNAEPDRKSYAIWKSALMRTSSRPVDMIFSIMGLFDVTLEISQFHKDDRIGATIALTMEILRRPGGRANWLGLCFFAPPCRELSIFPTFPQTAVAGKAMITTRRGLTEILRLMDNEYPNSEVLGPMPEGHMDYEGHFTFRSKSVRITRASAQESDNHKKRTGKNHWNSALLRATNGETWRVDNGEVEAAEDMRQTYAVLLGCFFGYTPTQTLAYDCNNVRAMIVSHSSSPIPGPGSKAFHVVSYLMLSISAIDWAFSWTEREFRIAPNLDDDDQGESEMYVPMPDKKSNFGNIESRRILDLAREGAERWTRGEF